MTAGVYQIKNLINNKVYIGSIARVGRFYMRWREHKYRLRRGIHHNPHLQKSWDKYGEKSFEFSIILSCTSDSCLENEQRTIDKLKACDRKFGYNIRLVSDSNLGVKLSDETKRKMSSWQIGRKLSDAHKQNISSSNKGRKFSAEAKMKMSKSHIGREQSSEHKQKILSAKMVKKWMGIR